MRGFTFSGLVRRTETGKGFREACGSVTARAAGAHETATIVETERH